MSSCIEKVECPQCGKNAFQIFQNDDNSYSAYCFACSHHDKDPYKDKPHDYKPVAVRKTKEQIAEEIAEIEEYQFLALPDRKLKKPFLEYFGVRIGVSQEDGKTPASHHYPYFNKAGELMGYKNRIIEGKRMFSTGDLKGDELFGWQQAIRADGRKLFITEGEVDCVSLYQILKEANAGTQYADRNPPVVSLPHGAAHASRAIAANLSDIRKHFDEVVLVFDMDEPGKAAAQSVLKIFPDAKIAELPFKDVNEGLMAGAARAIHAAVVFKADKPKNTRLVSGDSLHNLAKEPPKWGFDWPWKGINQVTRGIRLGETIYIGAGQKQGKSEIVNSLAAYFITKFGWKVFMAKPEEANVKTYRLVAGKVASKKFHDPSVDFDEAAFDEAGKVLDGKLFMLNLYQHVDWDTLKQDMRAAAATGCKAFFIDPITNLTNGMESGAANVKLQEIAQEASALALDLDVVIFLFCHLKNPEAGPPHERGGKVLSSQFAGSRAMARSCNLMIGLEGNRDPELTPEERNMRKFVVLENRETGEVGEWNFYWNPHTTHFTEV